MKLYKLSSKTLSTSGMGFTLSVTKKEASDIILSLSSQLSEDNPNTGRKEHSLDFIYREKRKEKTKRGVYFSVNLDPDELAKEHEDKETLRKIERISWHPDMKKKLEEILDTSDPMKKWEMIVKDSSKRKKSGQIGK